MAKRKLIEAAIPLDAINQACKADKAKALGTVRNLHKWFAPMPPVAWRALILATLLDDPGDEQARDDLLRLIEDVVASGGDLPDADVLRRARGEIAKSWPDGLPRVVDPFCGAGSTLVEAQRLGCETIGADLNPVPVLISKFLTELLPATANEPATINDPDRLPLVAGPFSGFQADARHYGALVRERALSELAGSYPSRENETVIAYLWARCVRCPNPACQVMTTLTTSWWLSKRRGNERYVVPSVVDGVVSYEVVGPEGEPPAAPKQGRGANFVCLNCAGGISEDYVADQGRAGGLGYILTAVMSDVDGNRTYRTAWPGEEAAALSIAEPEEAPGLPLPDNTRWFSPPIFGFTRQADLYMPRQLVVLETFARLVRDVADDLDRDGATAVRRAAVLAFLGLCVGRLAQFTSTQARLYHDARGNRETKVNEAFARHDIPMTWDFAETTPFAGSRGDWLHIVDSSLRAVPYAAVGHGIVVQRDARDTPEQDVLIATDPPYFDQIGYADLSDYFYVWHRKALYASFPDLYGTIATPKSQELVALAGRHPDGKRGAKRAFVEGFTDTFRRLAEAQHPDAPMLVVYAFKEQGKVAGEEIAPGWEAILEAVIAADLTIVGTWPVHATGATRMISMGTNALATYVVLVCRPRAPNATRITRSDLTRVLRSELADAVAELQHANIAPVDLAQAVIGPGMQVYSRHSAVIETDGPRMGVAQALALVNRTLAEILDEQEGDLDPDSRWAVTWYDDHSFDTAAFGKADQLARAKGIAVDSLVQAGIVTSGGGKVALIPRDQLDEGWDPLTDRRATAWEAVQYLVRALKEGGERAAAELYARLGSLADPARELAYRLFQIAEKKGRTDEALAYNGLVTSWSEIARLAGDLPRQPTATTEALF